MFAGPGFESNVYLIGGEVLVDAGTGALFQELKEEILNLGVKPDGIHTIIATHYHFDHTGGLKKLRDWIRTEGGEAAVAVHRMDAPYLEKGRTMAELFEQKAMAVTADRLLDDDEVIESEKSGIKLKVVHTPGHTPGSVCLFDKRGKTLISGDTLFKDGFGRTDYPGGDADLIKETLCDISKLGAERLLPGHGEPKIGGISFLIRQILEGSLSSARHK